MMKKCAYLLLGSNLGNRETNLSMARNLIENGVGAIQQLSKIYESAAWGKEDQPNFLNQVIQTSTQLEAHELWEKLSWIETSLGRQRKVKWGERIIDLDILFYENEIIDNDLTIPHPGIPQRRFTLLPLQEIAPQFVHPILNKTISQLLTDCQDALKVWPYTKGS